MVKITAQVEGMRCGMCEAHVNDVVRRAFAVKKVSSSHARGADGHTRGQDIDDGRLRKVIHDTGYEVTSITREPLRAKGRAILLPAQGIGRPKNRLQMARRDAARCRGKRSPAALFCAKMHQKTMHMAEFFQKQEMRLRF